MHELASACGRLELERKLPTCRFDVAMGCRRESITDIVRGEYCGACTYLWRLDRNLKDEDLPQAERESVERVLRGLVELNGRLMPRGGGAERPPEETAVPPRPPSDRRAEGEDEAARRAAGR